MSLRVRVGHLKDQFGRERKDFDYVVDSPCIPREEERLHMDELLYENQPYF